MVGVSQRCGGLRQADDKLHAECASNRAKVPQGWRSVVVLDARYRRLRRPQSAREVTLGPPVRTPEASHLCSHALAHLLVDIAKRVMHGKHDNLEEVAINAGSTTRRRTASCEGCW